MSVPSKKRMGVGFRNCNVYALDANGYPAATGATAYEGIHAVGAKTLTINDPAYTVINHNGDDSLIQIDQLPATTGATSELHLGRLDDDLEALFSGLKSFTAGEMNLFGAGITDQSGFEPTVGIMGYQQALDEGGNRVWHAVWFPRATVAKHESGLSGTPEDRLYGIVPSLATKHLWGTAMTAAVEGATRMQIVRGVSQYQPKLIAFLGDGATLIFTLPALAPAVAVNKIAVYNNGVVVSAGLTKTVTTLTFTTAPVTGNNISVLYEVAKAD
jgi:hypothetical protein